MMIAERFIQASDRRLWTRVMGSGPAVLLSLGAGHPGVGYAPELEGELARFATVISYDRAGLGRSDPVSPPPKASDMADDMAAVLNALAIRRPVLLTGFSMTALPAQLYASRHPSEVAGLLLLDPTPDLLVASIVDQPAFVHDAMRANMAAGPDLSPELAFEMQEIVASAVEVRDAIARSGLPDVPLIVATMQRGEASVLMQHHVQMAARIPKGRLVTASATSHRTFVHENTGFIAELVRQMLD